VLADAMRCWALGDKAGTIATIASKSGLIQYETSPGHSIAIRKEHWRRLGIIEHATVRPPTSPWSEDLDALSALHGYPAVSQVACSAAGAAPGSDRSSGSPARSGA